MVDLAGSYGAREAAFDVWQAALRAIHGDPMDDVLIDVLIVPGGALRVALENFLNVVRPEVGGESRPGLK